MERSTGPVPSSSQENSCIFSFDPQILAAAAASSSHADANGSIQSLPMYRLNGFGQNGLFPPRSSPMFTHCPPDSPPGLTRNGLVSSAYRLSHLASMQQPTWMNHTPSPHVSPFSPVNHQLPNRSDPLLQPSPLNIPGPSGITQQNGPVCNFGDQFFQAQLSNMQLVQHYQGEIAANNCHVPQNMIIRQPGPSLGTQRTWNQQTPSDIPQGLYNLDGAGAEQQVQGQPSQMFIVRPMSKRIHQNHHHSSYQTHDNLITLTSQTEMPRHVYCIEQPYSQNSRPSTLQNHSTMHNHSSVQNHKVQNHTVQKRTGQNHTVQKRTGQNHQVENHTVQNHKVQNHVQNHTVQNHVQNHTVQNHVQKHTVQNHVQNQTVQNHTVQNHSTLPNHVVKPIPIYSSKAPPGFECPYSLKFEGNCLLQNHTITKPTVVSREDDTDTKLTNHNRKEENDELKVERDREDDILVAPATGINPKQGKKRSLPVNKTIDSDIELQLEEVFINKRTPSQAELSEMAEKYNIGKNILRSWFSSRRQKQKKLDKVAGASKAKKKGVSSLNHIAPSTNHSEFISPGPKLVIPSLTHDITIEVPSINPKDRGSIIHKDYMMNCK